jgi:adenine-specific DNA-methyltransferase
MTTEKLDLQSPDLVNANFDKLAALFPNCVTESAQGKAIDFDLLKQELNHAVVEGNKERYRLEWPGKREAIVTANLPTTKTLRPIRAESVNFDTTQNLYIEGDNLEVLKLLQESYLNKIKMIYIDPPYNTGNDFVYKDNFTSDKAQELFDSGQTDALKNRLVVNPETAGRYHSDWLTMMYARLKLARNLLDSNGVIFVSIDDHEIHNLRKLLDEVFGEKNFIADLSIVTNLKGRNDKKYIATANERLLMYVKTDEFQEYGLSLPDDRIQSYSEQDSDGKYRFIELRKRGGPDTRADRPNMYYPFFVNPQTGAVSLTKNDSFNIEAFPVKSDGVEGRWRWGKDTASLRLTELVGKTVQGTERYNIYEKDYMEQDGELKRIKPKSIMAGSAYSTDSATKKYRAIMGEIDFSNPKSVDFLSDLIEYCCPPNNNSVVLDFFSGSATTAHAVMQLNTEDNGNRKYIMVQIPEATDEKSEAHKAGYKNICEIGKERIRRAGKSILDGITTELGEKRAQLAKYTEGSLGLSGDEKVETLTGDIARLKGVLANLDTGFRVYRLDESNMKDVYYKPQDITQASLDLFADNVKTDRTADDLLAQVMLDWGLPLSLNIEQADVSGKRVFKVAGNSLYACFDSGIDEAFAKAIAEAQPLRIVFHDSGFANDTAKINVKQLLKQLSPDTEMKVI